MTYLILPGCDDTNRGDQALIWETATVARAAGFIGDYYMVAAEEKSRQSAATGIQQIDYILAHPASHFRLKDNFRYTFSIKFRWALVSLADSAKAVCLFFRWGRFLACKFGPPALKRSLAIFEHAEAAFVKGGGFLHAYGGLTSTYSVFYNLYHIILAQRMGKKIYVMPNSFGPFYSWGSQLLVSSVLKKCELITAREKISANVLHNMRVPCRVFPDLAFYLKSSPVFTPDQYSTLEHIPFNSEKCVGLTVRPYRFPGTEHPEECYQNYTKAVFQFICYLSNAGYFPVLIEHTYSDTTHERDMHCIRELTAMLGKKYRYAVYSDRSLNCQQLKYVYSRFFFLIGTRFHSVIFSLAAGVPSLAITYGGNKGNGIMRDIGLAEYAIPIEGVNANTLVERFNHLVSHADDVKAKIDRYLDSLPTEYSHLLEALRGQ